MKLNRNPDTPALTSFHSATDMLDRHLRTFELTDDRTHNDANEILTRGFDGAAAINTSCGEREKRARLRFIHRRSAASLSRGAPCSFRVLAVIGQLVLLIAPALSVCSAAPLHQAVTERDRGALAALLREHVDPDEALTIETVEDDVFARNLDDEEPPDGSQDWRAWTIARGWWPVQQIALGVTPLMVAAGTSQPNAVGLLLDAGADPNSTDSRGFTPLFYAVVAGDAAIVKRLLAAGSNVNAIDEEGWTPLWWAVEQGSQRIVSILLDHGADVNNREVVRGETVLMMAVWRGRRAIVRQLIAAGADPNEGARDLRKPLHHAATEFGSAETLQILLNAGADPNSPEMLLRITPLMTACGGGDPEQVRVLIEAGGDVHARDKRKRTPLMHAASSNGAPKKIELLLEAGASISARDVLGQTALFSAAHNDRGPEAARLLLKAGARADDADFEGETPLMEVCRAAGGAPETVDELLKAGAPVDARGGPLRWTALLHAADAGNKEAARRLLIAGADPTVRDAEGKTAVEIARDTDWASEERIAETVELLEKAMREVDKRAADEP